MKRIFTLIALIGLMAVAYAQRPVATLSHEGKLTMFTSGRCFGEAHDAAVDGDTIYLSNGTFTDLGLTNKTISKRVSFIGNGRRTYIASELFFQFPDGMDSLKSALFDGVYLEKLSISGYNNVKNLEIKNSRIQTLDLDGYGTCYDTKIDRCEIYELKTGNATKGYEIYNSKIANYTGSPSAVEGARLFNCHLIMPDDFVGYISSSIIYSELNQSSSYNRILEKCIIMGPYSFLPQEEGVRGCYINPSGTGDKYFDENMNFNGLASLDGFVGIDGTQVGIYGGEWFPYTEEPSLPTVDKEKSTVEYDATENKLKVNITVTAN